MFRITSVLPVDSDTSIHCSCMHGKTPFIVSLRFFLCLLTRKPRNHVIGLHPSEGAKRLTLTPSTFALCHYRSAH